MRFLALGTGAEVRILARHFVGIATVLIAGCDARPDPPSVSESDSAGVPVYTLGELPPWTQAELKWDLTLERSIRTGADSPNDAPRVFQPQGYLPLQDGRLVVLDGAETRLVVIDSTRNEVLHRFGPTGQGPGEIWSSNSLMWPAGADSFWILDPGNQRLSRFTASGELVEESPVTIPGMAGVAFQDPLRHAPWFWKIFAEDDDERTRVDSIGRLDQETGRVVFVAPMAPRIEERRRGIPGDQPALLAPLSWFAPLGSTLVVGRNDSGRFRIHDEAGLLVGVVDVPMEQSPIADHEKPALLQEYFGMASGRTTPPARPVSDFFPLYDLMWGVTDSLFALQQSHLSTPLGEPRIPAGQVVWRIFSIDGTYAGALELPPGVAQPYWIEEGRVIATHRDDLGVTTIQTFRLTPPGG